MTAQQNQPEDRPAGHAEEQVDPIGPIGMPQRSLIGARAYALIGAASVIALGVHIFTGPGTATPPTVSVPIR